MPLFNASTIRGLSLTLAGLLGAAAGNAAWAQKAPAGAVCTSNAWTGTVSYMRSQSIADSKTTERVSGRGKDTRDFQLNYRYKAVVAVTEGPATASIDHSMTTTETAVATESNSCDRGKSWQEMSGTFTHQQETTGQGKDRANVTIGVNDDGTYTVGVAAPRIKGMVSGSDTSSFSGQCTKKEGKSTRYPPTETTIDGGSLVSNGRHRVDPQDPTRLSGAYSENRQGVTETISWNLQKCGAELRVTDLIFEEMKFPTWDNWQEVVEQRGTVDGNWVRVKATVFNGSADRRSGEVYFKETYKGDKWDGARPDRPLKQQTAHVSLDPGEAKEVEILWDTSGYSWFDDGRPRLVQRVKAELWEKDKLASDLTRNIRIAPKPVVLVHGPFKDWKTFETWQNMFTTTHSYDWKAYAVGENAARGKIQYFAADADRHKSVDMIASNATQLQSYIRYAQEDRNAWHVDVIGHSAGGIVARYYISRLMPEWYPDGRPQIFRFLMLGTPNLGSPCAEEETMSREALSKHGGVFRQLDATAMAAFNQQNSNRNGVRFAALAGTSDLTECAYVGKNDGFVAVPSAHWTVADRAESDSEHEELTSAKDFTKFVKPRLIVGPRGDFEPAK